MKAHFRSSNNKWICPFHRKNTSDETVWRGFTWDCKTLHVTVIPFAQSFHCTEPNRRLTINVQLSNLKDKIPQVMRICGIGKKISLERVVITGLDQTV